MIQVFEKLGLKKVDSNEFKLLTQYEQNHSVNNYDSVHTFFHKTHLIAPDDIKRPKGDTTFFTTAGVQHIETLQRQKETLKYCAFSVYQPCIRSQYMEDTKEGTSTSFVNFSSVILHGNIDDFASQTNAFINVLLSRGISPDKLRFIFSENVPSAWKDKKFGSNNLSIYVGDVEIGECIFVPNLPLSENKNTSLVEVGLGIERLNWASGNSKYYHTYFEKDYEENINRNIDEISSLIDCVKTSTLIVSSGVIPSPKDHGYRARKLLKKFNDNNKGLLNLDELISISYNYWAEKGANPKLQKHVVQLIINREVERLELAKLQQSHKNKNYDNTDTKNILQQELNKNKGR